MISQISEVVLAFGSNQGDRGEIIRAAQQRLAEHPEISAWRASPLRETLALTPSGIDPDAPRYLNGVALCSTTLSPDELLTLAHEIESEFGRVRAEQWGDRTLDIDIISFGGTTRRSERLTIPHPRAHERDFVLAPWLDLDADAVLIGHGRVAELLVTIGDTTQRLPEETHS